MPLCSGDAHPEGAGKRIPKRAFCPIFETASKNGLEARGVSGYRDTSGRVKAILDHSSVRFERFRVDAPVPRLRRGVDLLGRVETGGRIRVGM